MNVIIRLDIWFFVQLMYEPTTAVILSYNQPTFCSTASWNPNATTFATNTKIGSSPHAVFVNRNNSVYVANQQNGQIMVWAEHSTNVTKIIPGNLSNPYSIFVTFDGDIYSNNDQNGGEIKKWSSNTVQWSTIMSITKSCYGVFVDNNDTLYCSMKFDHRVVKTWLNNNASMWMTAAGTGAASSTMISFDQPLGIFVDANLALYVADCGNNRIQFFKLGMLNGVTIAGNDSLNTTISLSCPAGVVLDADQYLFIVDQAHHRIVGSGPNGFRCLVGCSGVTGSAANELSWPMTLSFDTYGNMFVSDIGNDRIQKYLFLPNSCEITTTTTTAAAMYSTSTLDVTSMVTTSSLYQSSSTCDKSRGIGLYCNISNKACDHLQPCQHNSTCYNNDTKVNGYFCLCPSGFTGTQCQFDERLCQPNTCWNNGTCNETSNTTFICHCQPGWQDDHCEEKIDYCGNVTCENHGICRSLVLDYKCECLGESFSGRHCEIISVSTKVRRIISKSFAYVAIIAMIIVVTFIIVMDVLKYCFNIQPTNLKLEKFRRNKRAKMHRKNRRSKCNSTLIMRKITFSV